MPLSARPGGSTHRGGSSIARGQVAYDSVADRLGLIGQERLDWLAERSLGPPVAMATVTGDAEAPRMARERIRGSLWCWKIPRGVGSGCSDHVRHARSRTLSRER